VTRARAGVEAFVPLEAATRAQVVAPRSQRTQNDYSTPCHEMTGKVRETRQSGGYVRAASGTGKRCVEPSSIVCDQRTRISIHRPRASERPDLPLPARCVGRWSRMLS
jgi:hypothetical protein